MPVPIKVRGCRPDRPWKRHQRDARELLATAKAATLPDSFSYRTFETVQLDQGDIGDCTCASTAQGLVLVSNIGGATGPFSLGWVPSQRIPYAGVRSLERAANVVFGQPVPLLTDSGAELADVITFLQRYGIATMGAVSPDGNLSDVWDANVDEEVDLQALEKSGTQLVTGEYRINPSTGATQAQAILMAANAPLWVGGFVDSQVMRFTANSPSVSTPNQGDPNGGGHAFLITGWRPSVLNAGQVDWECWTTWGWSYGDAGHWWAQESFFAALWDVYVMTARWAR